MLKLFQCFFVVVFLISGTVQARGVYEDPLEASMEIWVREAVRHALSYSHSDYKERQEENKKFFTEKAHEFYVKHVNRKDKFAERVQDEKWDMIAVDKKSMLGQREKIRYEELDVDDDGMHYWRIHLPIETHLVRKRERMPEEHKVYPFTAVVDVKQTKLKAPYDFTIYNWVAVMDYDPYAIDRIKKP